MATKLAIDWDEAELRLVAAQCSGSNVKVTDAAVIPVDQNNFIDTLRTAIESRGLDGTETLIAIGRGQAELRELQLPPVPDDELPDMVRFQAIRSFASAGDSATVDYLVTKRGDEGIEIIAAAVGPTQLADIREACEAVKLETTRISLRPLAAAALYLINRGASGAGDTVLIDLLANDAEIVVARDGRVIFIRTVRMPTDEATRGRALAGELRRSLAACGSSGSLDRVILWGRQSVHIADQEMLAEASGSQVDVLDPFDLVDVDRKAKAGLPEHVGRLAPLIGLLAADENDADRLLDFLNPRQRVEEKPSPYRNALIGGVAVAAVLLLGYMMYSQLKGLDLEISNLNTANAQMKPDEKRAIESVDRTSRVDAFLDGDVNWLSEVRRLADSMPPSDQMIVRSVAGSTDHRGGGGTLTVVGAATGHAVIGDFERALRDSSHTVIGKGVSEQDTEDAYKFDFTASIRVSPESIYDDRYAAMIESAAADTMPTKTQPDEPEPEEPEPDEPEPDEPEPDEPEPDESPSDESFVSGSPEVQS